MGTKINRIEKEFILKGAVDQKAIIQIHGTKKELEGKLIHFDEKLIIIEKLAPIELNIGDEIIIFLFFRNNMHTFNAKIKDIEGDKIYINQPEGMYKRLQRKYDRIRPPADIRASFALKGKNFELDYPKTTIFRSLEKPKGIENLEKSSIDRLINEFRRKMASLVSGNEIIMLKKTEPSTFEEMIMLKTGKMLWLPSINKGYMLENPFPDERILTKHELIAVEGKSDSSDNTGSTLLENNLDDRYRNNIYSELYTPIIYNQYFVGYLHIYNTQEKKEEIKEELVEYLHQFSRVFCYSLSASGYFDTLSSKDEVTYEAQIIDLSASGLLFVLPKKDLSQDILVHTEINICLQIGERKIKIGCRIIRKFMDRDRLYIGLQFLDILPEDFRLLFETIYGKPFLDEYLDKWEGGIPPPELHLE